MKPIFVRVVLFDPVTEETFPVHEGFDVSMAKVDTETWRMDIDPLPLAWDEPTRCFTVDAPDYRPSRKHYLVVTFEKRNFSKVSKRLLSYDEAVDENERLWAPTRLPYWDSGWDDGYRSNEYFGLAGWQRRSGPDDPLVLRVPIRRIYVLGHRGAPHAYPENTLAAFRAALDMGANALEFDTCITKDGRIAVFHDAMPTKQPPRIDRTKFEKMPYELVSPTFNITGRTATFYGVEDGQVEELGSHELEDRHELDLVKMSFEEAREVYRFPPVDGEEHRLIDLDEFLDFASEERERLHLLFFDVKPPGDLDDVAPAQDYGHKIGEALRRHPELPERIVVAYADTKVLQKIRAGVEETGEDRAWYAFDAAGGVGALLRGITRGWTWLPRFLRRWLAKILPGVPNPIRTARRMGNRVVSIGTLARPAHLAEIREAVRDRDYRPKSSIEMVVHWTLNEREDFAHSLEAGVNGILTDKPDDLVAYLKELGVRVT